ncbi:MAG TPA: acyltransferase domain-containing protein, partial [Rhodocyclaceae bacterium]|nr:acyltransferase domain-containing protein [Rhodocyclaceae bacterium]
MPSQQILALSATSLAELTGRLQSPPGQTQAADGPWRIAIVAADGNTLADLRAMAATTLAAGKLPQHPEIFVATPEHPVSGTLAWLFPGQGSQALGMLMPLAEAWPAYRQHLHRLDAAWSEVLGESVLSWIAAADTADTRAHLTDTRQAQLALGLVEAALTAAWRDAGLDAMAYAGHSYGELPALAAAGAIDEDTLYALSRQRGLLLGEAGDLAPGGMLAAKSDRDTLQTLLAPLADRVFIANDNAPRQVVIAGSHTGIAAASELLAEVGIAATPLRTACAFHSPLMSPVGDRWRQFLATRHFAPIAAGRAYSNAGAQAYAGDGEGIRAGLAAQLTAPVRWRDEIEALYDAGCRTFVEIGPGRVLSDLTARILGERPHLALTTDPGRAPAAPHLARLFAQLWVLGTPLDLSAFAPSARPPLPETPLSHSPRSVAMTAALPSSELPPSAPMNSANAAAEHPYFSANQQAVSAFFTQQQQLVAAVGPQSDSALFQEMIRANQAVMQDFLNTQQLALQAGGLPATTVEMAPPMPSATLATPATAPANSGNGNDIESWIIAQLAEMTGLPSQRIGRNTQFESELGLDSITLVELWVQLNERFPHLGQQSDQISSVTCIADILQLISRSERAATPAAPVTDHPAPANDGKSIEAWLLNELSMLTGLPADRLNRDTQFEAELGIDSITMVELWIKLVEQFPQFGEHTDGASRVRCVADVLSMVGADQPAAPAASTAKIVEHPASDWLSKLRANIVARIAEERGIDPATITGQSHFANDLGLDIFTR